MSIVAKLRCTHPCAALHSGGVRRKEEKRRAAAQAMQRALQAAREREVGS